MKCSCGRALAPTPSNVVGVLLNEDVYAVLCNCAACGSTRSAVLWLCDELAAEERADFEAEQREQAAAAAQYEADEAPLDRAALRPFFSTALELTELGL